MATKRLIGLNLRNAKNRDTAKPIHVLLMTLLVKTITFPH